MTQSKEMTTQGELVEKVAFASAVRDRELEVRAEAGNQIASLWLDDQFGIGWPDISVVPPDDRQDGYIRGKDHWRDVARAAVTATLEALLAWQDREPDWYGDSKDVRDFADAHGITLKDPAT